LKKNGLGNTLGDFFSNWCSPPDFQASLGIF
jgi:hypothetical protein